MLHRPAAGPAGDLDVPGPLPEVALRHARRLEEVAAQVGEALSLVVEVHGLVEGWTGPAAEAFRADARAVGDVDALVSGLREAAAALAAWSAQAPAEAAAARAAADGSRRAREAGFAVLARGEPVPPDVVDAQDRAHGRWVAALHRYDTVTVRAARALRAVAERLPGHRPSAGSHVRGFARTLWQDGVVSTVAGTWSLTGALVTDRRAFTGAWSALARGSWGLVRHPWSTAGAAAEDAVGAPAWSQGRYGEGLASIAMLVGAWRRPVARAVPEHPHGPDRVPPDAPRDPRLSPDAPLPRLQPVSEMLSRVDLWAHEHARLGHTIDRHVAKSDRYLVDRLVLGTLEPSGVRTFKPPSASTWHDLRTAELAITKALLAHPEEMARCARVLQCASLRAPVEGDVGRVVTERPGGGFAVAPASELVVHFAVHDGPPRTPYIKSAYLESGDTGRPLALEATP